MTGGRPYNLYLVLRGTNVFLTGLGWVPHEWVLTKPGYRVSDSFTRALSPSAFHSGMKVCEALPVAGLWNSILYG